MILPALAIVSILQCTSSCGTPLTNADVRLVATAPSRILVGEFVTIRTTWTARHRIKEPVEYGWIEIDRGAGFQEHVEGLDGWSDSVSNRELREGRSIVTEHVVGLAGRSAPPQLDGAGRMHAFYALAFDRPGRYRLKVRYDSAESNVMVVEAVAPNGEDARLLETLRLRPAILSAEGPMEAPIRAEGQELVRVYGRHRLLKPFLDWLDGRRADAVRRVDREGSAGNN